MAYDDIHEEAKERFPEAYDAADDAYTEMLSDLEFAEGKEQWPRDIEAERKKDGRPCLVINKLPAFCDQIIAHLSK